MVESGVIVEYEENGRERTMIDHIVNEAGRERKRKGNNNSNNPVSAPHLPIDSHRDRLITDWVACLPCPEEAAIKNSFPAWATSYPPACP